MAWIFVGIFLLGLVVTIFTPWMIRFMKVDRCLDQGGRFNFVTNKCEFGGPQADPAVPDHAVMLDTGSAQDVGCCS